VATGGKRAHWLEVMNQELVFEPSLAFSILKLALGSQGGFADLYGEERRSISLRLEDGKIEQATVGMEQGAALRVVRGDSTLFGYVDFPTEAALINLARQLGSQTVRAEVRTGIQGQAGSQGFLEAQLVNPEEAPPDYEVSSLAHFLHMADEVARRASPEVRQVIVTFTSSQQKVWIANSEGLQANDVRLRTAFSLVVAAQRDGVLQTARDTLAWLGGPECLEQSKVMSLANKVARTAVDLLDARPAPAGRLAVVIANGFGGVLFHEACGHGLEADHVAKKSSVWEEKIGERVAPSCVSAFDDGTLPGMWGSGKCDDEGTPCQRTMLIAEGVLTAYLTDRLRASQLGLAHTGNGRRQDYRSLPYPRMTNTFIAPGSATKDALIADTKHGLYAKSFSGGQVNPATGDFVFGVEEGYLIENGRITAPVRGATLIGNSLRVLEHIDGIADDLEIRAGTCGKEGQSVPVGSGQPTLRVREMTVGGTGL